MASTDLWTRKLTLSDDRIMKIASGVGQAESVSGVSQSSSTSESDSSHRTKQSQPQPQPQPRARTTSKTSRRSRKSSRREAELRLILGFPLPPTFIPTPPKVRTPPPSRPPPEVAPINDDESIFYVHDPFRAWTGPNRGNTSIPCHFFPFPYDAES
ncbi:hypothetical protein BJV77DRAFT_987308 [Russula vinacea]|nr:hypothetical protein BJV77DRAFT_987308 [Russula vinacea]